MSLSKEEILYKKQIEYEFLELEINNLLTSNEQMLEYSKSIKDNEDLVKFQDENTLYLNECIKRYSKLKEEIDHIMYSIESKNDENIIESVEL